MWQKLALLAVAGGVGTLARYGLSGWAQKLSGSSGFPWGTLAVNLTGCFLAGFAWSVFESRLGWGVGARTIILVGFMGGFTTFSAYALETGNLLRDAEWTWALGNAAMQNIGGLACFFIGLITGRVI
ncbi:MAG: CrcB family protein [Candidatus Sumerlaeota bacterium]|nr:CrcB family protein [Candidatus Sumerlaeota bacterium]